jgi:hypothetical protein
LVHGVKLDALMEQLVSGLISSQTLFKQFLSCKKRVSLNTFNGSLLSLRYSHREWASALRLPIIVDSRSVDLAFVVRALALRSFGGDPEGDLVDHVDVRLGESIDGVDHSLGLRVW